MSALDQTIVSQCRRLLLEKKSELLNRIRTEKSAFAEDLDRRTGGGDEGDQSVAILEENNFLIRQTRLLQQLAEIDSALARMETGHYGICEETEEIIELDRLMSIPWTRLSIEGAELREAMSKRFAR